MSSMLQLTDRRMLEIASTILISSGMLWFAFRWRKERREVERRLTAERRAVARTAFELHDALLQGLQGVLLKFATAQLLIQQGKDGSSLLDLSIQETESLVITARSRIVAMGVAELQSPLWMNSNSYWAPSKDRTPEDQGPTPRPQF